MKKMVFLGAAVTGLGLATTAVALTRPRPVQLKTTERRVVRIVVAGGGYIGLIAAQRLRKRLGNDQAEIAVIDPRSYMTYQPFLPEAASGNIEPRHVVAPHREVLRNCTLLTGKVSEIRHHDRTVVVIPEVGQNSDYQPDPYEISYDHLIVGLGSESRTLPLPGLAETAIGFKQVEEAIALRNQVLTKMDIAASTWDKNERERLLTFVFIGGGFAGVEALGEVQDMAHAAARLYPDIAPEDLRFVLVEGSRRILPELGDELGGYALEQLTARGIEIFLNTYLSSCVEGHIKLSDGTAFEADTVVWTAGVKANPMLTNSDLPLDEQGRVRCSAALQVISEDGPIPGLWAAGDCAQIPDLAGEAGDTCAPTAQHAVRQAKLLADNLIAVLEGEEPVEYCHHNVGTVASLGLGKGVAQIMGIKMRGPLAWFAHRTYHMLAMPTLNRKIRIIADWTTALLFRRELVALGSLTSPKAAFRAAAAVDAQRANTRPGAANSHKTKAKNHPDN